MADDRPVLALVSGARRVDETALAGALGATTVRRATADEARRATGYAIGGTPPFGHTGDGVSVTVCDPALLQHDVVWAAAGGPQHVFPIAPVLLLEVSGARIVDIAP
jgi:prolyl-tRNA editing enzyme YbaK/EbsC (Cys-tRNA(Pro) deacylase)